MSFCHNCGKEILQDSKFCYHCGTKLDVRYAKAGERHAPQSPMSQTPPIIPEDLPREVIINESSMNGDPNSINVWVVRGGFILFILLSPFLLLPLLAQESYFAAGSYFFALALLGVGSDLIYKSLVKRTARFEIKTDGVHISPVPIYGGLFHIDGSFIPMGEISYVQNMQHVDVYGVPDGRSRRAAASNNLVLYLKNGKIVSFWKRDTAQTNLAYQVLLNKYSIKDEGQKRHLDTTDIYRSYRNSWNWKKEWFIFAGIMIPIGMMTYFLATVASNMIWSGADPIDYFLVTFVSIFLAAFGYLIFFSYRSLSIGSVEITKNGLRMQTKRSVKEVPWSSIQRIEATLAENMDKSKQMFSILYLSKHLFYKLDYEIGIAIQAANQENTGRTIPTNMSGMSVNNRPVANAEIAALRNKRPDLVKKMNYVQIGFFSTATIFLINLVFLNLRIITLLGFVLLIVLFFRRSKLKKQMEIAITNERGY